MFIKNIHGKEAVTAKARAIGIDAGEVVIGSGYGTPALGGGTYKHKDTIKSCGGRWNSNEKVWCLESWEAIAAVLEKIGA